MSESGEGDRVEDVVLLHSPTESGDGIRVVRKRKDSIELGELRPMKEGQPIHGEVVRLTQRAESERLFDCEVMVPSQTAKEPSAGAGAGAGAGAAASGGAGDGGTPKTLAAKEPAAVQHKGPPRVAREFIHPRSHRPGPFVAVDLSTLPTDLMAAHLFGVVKGAYTGATNTREGVLTRAHGGTLFLDEIGNLSLELQKSLLLVLQEGVYRPVGAVKEIVTDIKIVVATNENLGALVRAGRFREDLYMRLNPATAVTLPGLRERRDDFEELLAWFMRQVVGEAYNRDLLAQYAEQRGLAANLPISAGRGVPPRDARRIHFLLHPSSFKLLHDFEWPGNFRQFAMTLSNLVTFTLVELVERAEKIEPERPGEGRPDVIPIPPKIVSDLLRPMTPPEVIDLPIAATGPRRYLVELDAADSLNAVSCAVERQYLEQLYERCGADLGQMAGLLLGDDTAGRKVQLRMNQLGMKLRVLKRKTGE